MNMIKFTGFIFLLIFLPFNFQSSGQSLINSQQLNSQNLENKILIDKNATAHFYDNILKFSDLLINYANITEEGWSWKRFLNLRLNCPVKRIF